MPAHPATLIAPIRPDQVIAVGHLFHRVWHEAQASFHDARLAWHRGPQFFIERIRARGPRTLVAIEAGQIIGFASWTGRFLESLYVAAEARGRGIGQRLYRAAEDEMRREPGTGLALTCVEVNWMARRFYEGQGFRVAARQVEDSQTPEGAVRVSLWRMVKT
jgi:ribosomal protein S18 acetylase RimI-like enzyme